VSSSAALALRVLRAEGPRSFAERLLGRAGEWRRTRSFSAPHAGDPPLFAAVLNLLGTPPWPHLGGVQLQLAERLAAERHRRPVALLHPRDGRYRLEFDDGERRRALDFGALAPPSSAVAARPAPAPAAPPVLFDPTFERAVRAAVTCVDAAAVHLENAAGLPLGSLAALAEEGKPWILSLHDFSLFCPRPHLMEQPADRFCRYSTDPERCAACLSHDWPVALGFQEERRALARRLLAAAAAVVHPSDFLRRQTLDLFPGLDPARHHVIAPAARLPHRALAPTTPVRPPRHLAFVGSVQPYKGAPIFEELVRRLAPDHAQVRWSVFGGGDAALLRRLRSLPGVRVRGFYRPGTLGRRLRAVRGDLALLLSPCPETYSLTLEECAAAGIPVLAFDQGAIAERVRLRGGGVLVPAEGGTEALAPRLADLLAGREPLPPAAAPTALTGDQAAVAWLALYREVQALAP